MKKATILSIVLIAGCALGAAIKPAALNPKRDFDTIQTETLDLSQPPTNTNVVVIQLSVGTAQELLLALSGALNPTAPIAIPDNPACRTKK